MKRDKDTPDLEAARRAFREARAAELARDGLGPPAQRLYLLRRGAEALWAFWLEQDPPPEDLIQGGRTVRDQVVEVVEVVPDTNKPFDALARIPDTEHHLSIRYSDAELMTGE